MKLSVQIEIDQAMDLETQKKKVSIGRSSENDLVVTHKSISRNHCILEEDRDGKFYLTDLGSSNGSFIGETKLTPNKRTLVTGRYLTLGRVECEIRVSSPENTEPRNVVKTELTSNGDATATIRISRLELNRPSITLENEKKMVVAGPRNPISQKLDREPVKPIRQSKRGFLYFILALALIAAWYLGEQ